MAGLEVGVSEAGKGVRRILRAFWGGLQRRDALDKIASMGPEEGRGWGRRQELEEQQMPLGFHAIAVQKSLVAVLDYPVKRYNAF